MPLLALAWTGEPTDGAALILAMTLAQVMVPLSRFGQRLAPAGFLRALVRGRSLALAVMSASALQLHCRSRWWAP